MSHDAEQNAAGACRNCGNVDFDIGDCCTECGCWDSRKIYTMGAGAGPVPGNIKIHVTTRASGDCIAQASE